ncbi:phosphoinositide phospholipase C 2-like isoform X2 [Hordeum vulgare subsp. vulgare]|uniref:phosphoinositide phospholipase C 2-like isoform X2 n=1 Tax=Hordeum vulgare subsp. vulgare TaxID=112509 RepID=UPI001D1A414A|nr:phosphoinositide phospholipase C 2-like isoform X2 [Hordeum vulgare subsp. vulgare]
MREREIPKWRGKFLLRRLPPPHVSSPGDQTKRKNRAIQGERAPRLRLRLKRRRWGRTSAASSSRAGSRCPTRPRRRMCARSSPASPAARPTWASTSSAATLPPPGSSTATAEWKRRRGSWTGSSRAAAAPRVLESPPSPSTTSTTSSSPRTSTRPSVSQRTLTAPVSLLKCLTSIKEYAFVASPYPVIITLEDHLTSDLQAKVAKMVLEVFGDILYYPESKHLQEFPSPEALKGRVILSTKPPKEYLEAKGGTMKDRDIEPKFSKGENEESAWGIEVPDIQDELQDANKDDVSYHERGVDEDDEQKVRKSAPPEYKHLITIKAGKPKGSLVDALKSDPEKVRRLSLSEQELAKVASRHGPKIVSFTQRNLLRIYPKGTRFNSSNYNPFLGWVHGAQMVAFNMQGYGRALWLMNGFYKANGGCGYVKKPDFLMQTCPDGKVFDPTADLPVKKTLKVKVYMGDGWQQDFKQTHFDSYSPPDFYAKVGIAGVPSDSVMRKTRVVEDSWVPVWEDGFTFPLTVPEIALLRVEVHEYDVNEDDFGGQTVLPVSELWPGIRTVPLFDHKGMKFKSVKLLMSFEFV